MPRSPREDYEGASHHVMNRGAGRRNVFADDFDRATFLDRMAHAAAITGMEIHAYCLMSNHFHLLVRSRAGKLSQFLKLAVGRYSAMHNRRHETDGPLFKARSLSIAIEDSAQLVLVSRYIHLNPVVAGLVERPSQWRWSSAGAFLGVHETPEWLKVAELWALFAGSSHGFDYAAYLAAGVDEATDRRCRERGW